MVGRVESGRHVPVTVLPLLGIYSLGWLFDHLRLAGDEEQNEQWVETSDPDARRRVRLAINSCNVVPENSQHASRVAVDCRLDRLLLGSLD